ncbi:MAG: Cell division initiation protein DivIVA, partial [uncultured Corynebacteriales bacterium]
GLRICGSDDRASTGAADQGVRCPVGAVRQATVRTPRIRRDRGRRVPPQGDRGAGADPGRPGAGRRGGAPGRLPQAADRQPGVRRGRGRRLPRPGRGGAALARVAGRPAGDGRAARGRRLRAGQRRHAGLPRWWSGGPDRRAGGAGGHRRATGRAGSSPGDRAARPDHRAHGLPTTGRRDRLRRAGPRGGPAGAAGRVRHHAVRGAADGHAGEHPPVRRAGGARARPGLRGGDGRPGDLAAGPAPQPARRPDRDLGAGGHVPPRRGPAAARRPGAAAGL